MISMLTLWAGGHGINTQSGTINDTHYITTICYLVDEVSIVVSAILRMMHVHSPQGDEIGIRVCP